MSEPAQRNHRPDDFLGILLRTDRPFSLDQLDPLIARHSEATRHGVDVGVDILRRNRHALLDTSFFNDLFIDKSFEHNCSVSVQALGCQPVLTNLSAVHHRHHLVDRHCLRTTVGRRF